MSLVALLTPIKLLTTEYAFRVLPMASAISSDVFFERFFLSFICFLQLFYWLFRAGAASFFYQLETALVQGFFFDLEAPSDKSAALWVAPYNRFRYESIVSLPLISHTYQ